MESRVDEVVRESETGEQADPAGRRFVNMLRPQSQAPPSSAYHDTVRLAARNVASRSVNSLSQ